MSQFVLASNVKALVRAAALAGLACATAAPVALAQRPAAPSASDSGSVHVRLDAPADGQDPKLGLIYKQFYYTYKLAADDEIAVRLVGEPDYSLEKVKVSALGRIYHPLLGDIDVAGMTIPELSEKLTTEFREYFKSPRVSVDLVEANSAKVGVLGEVNKPGIVVMSHPMTVLDVIAESGGFNDFGSRSDVTVLRQASDGQLRTIEINVKRLMEGKANAETNIPVYAGDTVVVHSNKKKALQTIGSIAGIGTFLSYVRLGTGN